MSISEQSPGVIPVQTNAEEITDPREPVRLIGDATSLEVTAIQAENAPQIDSSDTNLNAVHYALGEGERSAHASKERASSPSGANVQPLLWNPAITSPGQPPALAAPWRVQKLSIDPALWELLLDASRRPTECGGVLIGNRDPATQSARVLGFLFPSQHTANSTYCAFDMQWVSLTRAALMTCNLDGRVTVIAWIHTHPRLSVFLSATDVSTIDMLQLLNPLTLAVVLDPYAQDMGAFHVERNQRDVLIDHECIHLEGAFAAELRALLDAPQLAGAEAAAVVSSQVVARPVLNREITTDVNGKIKISRQHPKSVPDDDKQAVGSVGREQMQHRFQVFERVFAWLARHNIHTAMPLATPLKSDQPVDAKLGVMETEATKEADGGSANNSNDELAPSQ